MKIVEIPYQIKRVDSFASRFLGYMGKSQSPIEEGLYFPDCSSAHMFFMSFPLDILFLNEDHRVLAIHANIQPWKVVQIKQRAHMLELPAGAVKFFDITEGVQLELRFQEKDI